MWLRPAAAGGKESGRPDSNRRPLGPKPSAIPGFATPRWRPDSVPLEAEKSRRKRGVSGVCRPLSRPDGSRTRDLWRANCRARIRHWMRSTRFALHVSAKKFFSHRRRHRRHRRRHHGHRDDHHRRRLLLRYPWRYLQRCRLYPLRQFQPRQRHHPRDDLRHHRDCPRWPGRQDRRDLHRHDARHHHLRQHFAGPTHPWAKGSRGKLENPGGRFAASCARVCRATVAAAPGRKYF